MRLKYIIVRKSQLNQPLLSAAIRSGFTSLTHSLTHSLSQTIKGWCDHLNKYRIPNLISWRKCGSQRKWVIIKLNLTWLLLRFWLVWLGSTNKQCGTLCCDSPPLDLDASPPRFPVLALFTSAVPTSSTILGSTRSFHFSQPNPSSSSISIIIS